MNKKITIASALLVLLFTSTAFVKQQNGISGYTGSPGEFTCSSCHSGGSSAASGTTISATPSFSNNEYVPGQNYTITVSLAASGFNYFGFGCEILTDANVNSGSMHNQGAGVKFLNAGARKNAVHTTPKNGTGGASFSFEWTAPSGTDITTIYVAGNAVVNDNNRFNDFPLAPAAMLLTAQEPLDPTGIDAQASTVSKFAVYPNPANGVTQISYYLSQPQRTVVELLDLNGRLAKSFDGRAQQPGIQTQFIDLQGLQPGLYFVRLNAGGRKVAQQLLSVY